MSAFEVTKSAYATKMNHAWAALQISKQARIDMSNILCICNTE